jgi:hypothetical protein
MKTTDGGAIIRTTNGGATWTLMASGTTELLSDVSFVDTMHGWAVGQFGTILRSVPAFSDVATTPEPGSGTLPGSFVPSGRGGEA